MIMRTEIQLTDESLLPVEQIPLGGRYAVRGYRENQFVRDMAVIASLESRIPIVRDTNWADYLQLAPFYDFGWAENKELDNPNPNQISSIGIGLRWGLTLPAPIRLNPSFEIYWGYPLRDVDTPGGDLQDDGWHFQFVVKAF